MTWVGRSARRPTVTHAAGVLRFDKVLADVGDDSKANHRCCRGVRGVHSPIPAEKRRWGEALSARTDQMQRSQALSGMSSTTATTLFCLAVRLWLPAEQEAPSFLPPETVY